MALLSATRKRSSSRVPNGRRSRRPRWVRAAVTTPVLPAPRMLELPIATRAVRCWMARRRSAVVILRFDSAAGSARRILTGNWSSLRGAWAPVRRGGRGQDRRGEQTSRSCYFFRSLKRPDLVFRIAAQRVPPHGFRRQCSAPGFLDSGLTVFASMLPRPARRSHVAPERGFDSGTSLASTARCTSA